MNTVTVYVNPQYLDIPEEVHPQRSVEEWMRLAQIAVVDALDPDVTVDVETNYDQHEDWTWSADSVVTWEDSCAIAYRLDALTASNRWHVVTGRVECPARPRY